MNKSPEASRNALNRQQPLKMTLAAYSFLFLAFSWDSLTNPRKKTSSRQVCALVHPDILQKKRLCFADNIRFMEVWIEELFWPQLPVGAVQEFANINKKQQQNQFEAVTLTFRV